jgi:hypothetical protein
MKMAFFGAVAFLVFTQLAQADRSVILFFLGSSSVIL